MPSPRYSDYPKVSVVISTYDRAQRLDAALASVHAQTYDDFEVIVVDDCSPPRRIEFPDEYRLVLEKWTTSFSERGIDLFAYRLESNSGYQCFPKNRGIEKSAGDYIAYLDDDNTWRPDHLSVCVNAIEYSPANDIEKPGGYSKPNFSTDMVYSRLCYHADEEAKKKGLPEGDAEGTEWDPRLLNVRNYIDTSTILHSKGAYWRLCRDSGYGWDETLRRFGDWNFVWRWGIYGNTAKLVNEVTVDYNWHAGSMQLSRPAIEVPVCLNFAQYQGLRKSRNGELASA